MSMRAPAPLLVLGIAAVAAAFSTGHPLVLGALAAGAIVLVGTAPNPPGRWLVMAALLSGLGLLLITPIVAAEGDLILLQGPSVPLFDTEVTLEELVAGGVSALRLMAVTLVIAGVLGHVDADRLQAVASRVAPRSALVVALAVRLLPALERDGRALGETARLRGAMLGTGSWTGRVRSGGRLLVPLVGSSLERGLDIAEAMAARGFGSGTPTRRVTPALTTPERVVLAAGVAAAGLVVIAWVTGGPEYRVYPIAESPFDPAAGLTAAAWGLAFAISAGALWSSR